MFTEEECTILAIIEEIMLISQNGLSDAIYLKAQIIMAIVTINAWNRIAIRTNEIVE